MPRRPLYQLEIAPLVLVSHSRSPFFSYASFEPIPEGSLVHIPFGKRHIEGIVFTRKSMPRSMPVWMKMVERVEIPSFLTEDQRSLALFLSETNFTPLANCLKHFIVRPAKTQTRDFQTAETPPTTSPAIKLSPSEKKIALAFIKRSKQLSYLLSPTFEARKKILYSVIETALRKGETVLFLVPELLLALWWRDEFKPYFESEMVLIHSKEVGRTLSAAWEDIRHGKRHFIIGTRQALFAPFAKLDHIIISDEEDQTSYKQWEMSPRFTARSVCQKLADLKGCKLSFVSPSPSLSAYTDSQIGTIKFLGREELKLPSPELINMRFERKREHRILSDVLSQSLARVLKQNEKAFLIGKQGGLSPFSICKQCRTVLRCPNCQSLLVSDKAGHFRCGHCGFKTNIFPTCPRCGHMEFKSFGAGTEKIEREVQRLFPAARILRLDRQSLEKKRELELAADMLRKGTFDILIGTYGLLKVPNLPSLSLIAMIEADSHLAFPDFQAEERLLHDSLRSLLLLGGKKPFGKAIFQTFDPEIPLFQETLGLPYEKALLALLEDRKALKYPPVYRLLRIECPAKNLTVSQKESIKLSEELKRIIQKGRFMSFSLISPHLPLSKAKQKHYQFFLRFPSTVSLPPKIREWCRKHSATCHFDLDPLNLN